MIKTISGIIMNLKKNLPYFILVTIYFFFVNLEARKDNSNLKPQEVNNMKDTKSIINDNSIRIKIPIIPYKHKELSDN
tara:strand:+ start:19 stop:252 length:234 start_codon:yes stop_codon:yes gene_type:complete